MSRLKDAHMPVETCVPACEPISGREIHICQMPNQNVSFFPLKFILGQSTVAYDLEFPFIECLENSSWLPSCWNEWTMNLQYLQEHGDSWWSLKAAG